MALRTKLVNLNAALDSHKTYVMEQYNLVHEHQNMMKNAVGQDET